MRTSVVREVQPVSENISIAPDGDMVVTIGKDGSPLSKFSDDTWDYSATSSSVKTLNFRANIERIVPVEGCNIPDAESLNSAIKFIKTLTINWVGAVGGCSMAKLRGDVNAITFLVRYCLDCTISVNKIFSTPDAIDFLIRRGSKDKQIGLFLGKIQRFVDTSIALSANPFWRTLSSSPGFQSRLKRARKMFPETTDTVQTLLIPSKIYQAVLKKTIEDLERFVEYEEALVYLFSMRTAARDAGVSLSQSLNRGTVKQNQTTLITRQWEKILRENSKVPSVLKELCDASISKNETWGGLADNLSRWQLRCAIVIAAFTGMRYNELLAIPLNGLSALSSSNGDIPVVWSVTTKLEDNGAPRFTKWVTSSIVEAAFKVARIITYGSLSWSGDKSIIGVNEKEIPLFLSTVKGKSGNPHPQFLYAATTFNLAGWRDNLYKDELEISEYDMAEISWFMYGESLPNTIQLGRRWPLSFHQFRRSMAVYAAASGLVSYPVLKSQLKHISMVMTVYYSESNSRAMNILGDEPEVKALRSEWGEAKARVEADELYQLIQSGQPLAGAAGKKIKLQQSRGDLPYYFEDRKVTKQFVKNGKIRYRPTLVGGCMSVKPCNKGAGVLASACISCESAVFLPGSKAALEQTKEFYEAELRQGVPKRARQEYENNIKQIDSFLNNLVETMEVN